MVIGMHKWERRFGNPVMPDAQSAVADIIQRVKGALLYMMQPLNGSYFNITYMYSIR